MAEIVAKRLAGHLERAGFVVLKRSPIGGGAALGRGFMTAKREELLGYEQPRLLLEPTMARAAKRSAAEAIKSGRSGRRQDAASPLPRWIPPQLCQLVEIAPSGQQRLHEIKLDGFRMSARIERGRLQLLTRTDSIGATNI